MAPSGGWPRAGRASKGPPKEVPLPWPDPMGDNPMGAGGGSERGESVKPQLGTQALPGQACSRVAGRENFGRTCSRVKRRETVCEAEAALVRRAAAEAEAGEKRAHALSETRGEGVRKSAYQRRGKGVKKRWL